MAKAVWTGTLSFGLVNIPVALFTATEAKDVRFHLFDRSGRRVHYRRVVGERDAENAIAESPNAPGRPTAETLSSPPASSAELGAEVPGERGTTEIAYHDLVRGYEVEPDRYVLLEPEEIERARPQRSRTIELEDFVRLEEIDPVYFEKSYYVAPRFGMEAEKPYLLLLRAMQQAGRAGIGRFVLRTKPHLVAIRPVGEVLGLETLYFGDEVRSPDEIASRLQGLKVAKRETDLAEQLIAMLDTEWNPEVYADEYRQELLQLIASKTPTELEPEPFSAETPGRVQELMEALKRSVEEARERRPAPTPKRRREAG